MKKLLIIISIFFSVTLTFGQFAPIGAEWYYNASGQGTAPMNAEYYHYKSELDTFVEGHSCKKISVTYYKFNGSISYLTPIFIYQRNDTVYYYNYVYSYFFPLYIFNVKQGDTLTYHSPVVPSNPADTLWKSIVDSVTKLIIDGDTLQRVWTTEPNTNAFSFCGGYIELIGSTFLMLHQSHKIYPEWDGPMRCYKDKTHFFKLNTFACDYLFTNGINKLDNQFEFLVFPNPIVRDQINIQSNNVVNFNLKIYNQLGQLVYKDISQFSKTKINIDEFASGFYCIELSTENKIERKYFIIEKQSSR